MGWMSSDPLGVPSSTPPHEAMPATASKAVTSRAIEERGGRWERTPVGPEWAGSRALGLELYT